MSEIRETKGCEMPEFISSEMRDLRSRVESLLVDLEELEGSDADDLYRRKAAIAKSKEYGVFQLTQPEEFGGAGAGPLALTIAREAVGAANSLVGRFVLGPDPGFLRNLSGELKALYLDPVIQGEKRWSFAFTEASGAAAPEKQTYAIREGDHLVVTGSKSFVSGGATADFFTTFVNVEESDGLAAGPTMALIDRNLPGVEVTRDFKSLEGGSHAELRFQQVHIPSSHTVGAIGEGMPRAMSNIGEERLQISAGACGMGIWTIRHITDRLTAAHRSGSRLSDREGVRLRYADMRIDLYAARSALYRTARLAESGEDVVNEAAATKVLCTETIGRVVDTAVQLAGGQALIEGEALEQMYRRVRSLRFAGGASDILRLSIARGIFDFDSGRV